MHCKSLNCLKGGTVSWACTAHLNHLKGQSVNCSSHITLHSLGSAENQRFRYCPRSLVFPRSARILSANQRQICVQTARFSLELSDWLAQSPDTLCGRGCGCACACDCYSKISLSCASKSSLTASCFRLIVSSLLNLHVQLPQTKAAFPVPNYCDTSPSERQK